MGAKVGQDNGGAISEINVTPLVDVMLVLLVVFMIASFAITTGMPVPLPESSTAYSKQDKGDHVVVSLDAEGKVYVGTQATKMERLIDDVNAEFNRNPGGALLIKGDRNLHYGQVREVMDLLAENGMTTLLLAADSKGASGKGGSAASGEGE
jgi:biopolymer transport protein ExbD